MREAETSVRAVRASLCALLLFVPYGAHAEVRADAGTTPAHMLEGHLILLAKANLGGKPVESVRELDELLARAYHYEADGRRDEATLLLLEAVEGPRFRSFESLASFAAAELTLASLLIDARALSTAERAIDRLIARGSSTNTFEPAVRLAVDVALVRGDLAASARALDAKLKPPLPPDAASEQAYLRGLAAHEGGSADAAETSLRAVSAMSRWYPSAQYMLGALSARRRDFPAARAHFCAVRRVVKVDTRARYASPKLFETADLAALGLARVAHEEGRDKAAFDYYFAVPRDSPRLAEALFEAAYASYERGRHDLADDSLRQLEASYPSSPFTAEARVLRGYVELARCDFERAETELTAFERTFGEVLRELSATLESPGRIGRLFDAQADADRHASPSLLLRLIARDAEVDRLRSAITALTAELARGKRVSRDLTVIAERLRTGKAPRARPTDDGAQGDDARIAALDLQLGRARTALSALRSERAALRRAGAKQEDLFALAKTERALERRCDAIAAGLRAVRAGSEVRARAPASGALSQRLSEDAAYVRSVRSHAARVLMALEAQLELSERRTLEALRARIERELRRARIGRIDAVMGKKRQLELQVESLAAGRFPPELSRQTARPALLRDDQEYWPFEGESWADEREEPPR